MRWRVDVRVTWRHGIVHVLPVCLGLFCGAGLGAAAQGETTNGQTTNAQRCAAAAERLAGALDLGDRAAIETHAMGLITLPGCDDGVRLRLRRRASRVLTALAVGEPKAGTSLDGTSLDETVARLRVARRIAQVWETLIEMANLEAARRDYKAATQFYQAALNDMAERYPGEPEAPRDRQVFAYQRANETQMLAPEEFAAAKRDGMAGGLDIALESSGSRAIMATRFLPITFLTASAEMTGQGRAIAERWWEGVRAGAPSDLLILGHADQRGTDAYNNQLSRERADSLARFLRSHGFTGRIAIRGFGKQCPVRLSSGAAYSDEEKLRINRRVEVVRGSELPEGYCSSAVLARH